MNPLLKQYVKRIEKQYLTGVAGEHAYREALSQFLKEVDPKVLVTNEPLLKNGKVDILISRENNESCFIETKDLGKKLNKLSKNEMDQKQRYLINFKNVVYTNYLDWEFYHNSELLSTVSVGKIHNNRIELIADKNDELNRNDSLLRILRVFLRSDAEKIEDSFNLASRLADKTHLIKHAMITSMESSSEDSSIKKQYRFFKKYLVSEISEEYFADIYAETITYGMFTAKIYHTNDYDFDRREIARLIPKSNPFLKNLFDEIASNKLDKRISLAINQLAKVLDLCEFDQIMDGFGKKTRQTDPIIHFYETFLEAYNPQKKKACGVFYTPDPVVKFIVRSVDDILQTEFGLADGLADIAHSKTKISGVPIDKVQILDPAVGTGSFLAETIRVIAQKINTNSSTSDYRESYVRQHLLNRINGFELLMAPYAICHLNLQRTINKEFEINIGKKENDRISVYLTNSLEDLDSSMPEFGFSEWLEEEIVGARDIKQDNPIMCIIGNPPYNEKTPAPKSNSIMNKLLEDYKKEPPDSDGIRIKLQEQNPRPINDLYVQFVRISSAWIEQVGEGVIAFIINHGFIDNATFRGMRWHLLDVFDKIWILDLHGHAHRDSRSEKDENIFRIQQGVSIILAVKNKAGEGKLASVFRGNRRGTREEKYDFLENLSIRDDKIFEQIEPLPTQYIFSFQSKDSQKVYERGFAVKELMKENSNGITAARNDLLIDFDRNKLISRLTNFANIDTEVARLKYNLGNDTRDWSVARAQMDVKNFDETKVTQIEFRPFDIRWTYYTGKTCGLMSMPRENIMKHMIRGSGNNIALIFSRRSSSIEKPVHVFVTNYLITSRGI